MTGKRSTGPLTPLQNKSRIFIWNQKLPFLTSSYVHMSLFNQSKIFCVRIHGTRSNWFTVRCCCTAPHHLSCLSFSWTGEEGVLSGNLRVVSDVVLLVSSSHDLQCALDLQCVRSWVWSGRDGSSRWSAPSGLEMSPCLRQRSLSISGSWSERWTDRLVLRQQ